MANMVEVVLGNYHVLTPNADKGTSLNVDFELFGTVLVEEESDFLQLYESSERRIREQILITIRSAAATDLTDPELGLIKRRILEKTNRALGRPLVHEVIFSKFSFLER
jgi:flagellar FliL protein